MIQISPEQRIYTTIRRICDELGYSVYDYLPDSKAEFPFIVLGEQFSQNFREHKDYYKPICTGNSMTDLVRNIEV